MNCGQVQFTQRQTDLNVTWGQISLDLLPSLTAQVGQQSKFCVCVFVCVCVRVPAHMCMCVCVRERETHTHTELRTQNFITQGLRF